ncbi:YrhB domain-containing protein [Kitasatospora purpeofusca]|uniref:YrhB domain-containing protein n=1 Tax=Kitasatospora purpeofusca TaxID=67352 RepID=UPI00340EDD93
MEISKERAVELISSLLIKQQDDGLELAVAGVSETSVGWVVGWNSAKFNLNPTPENFLIGCGPYLVDGEDGSIYQIPGETFRESGWEAMFLAEFKGHALPDELVDSTRLSLQTGGRVSAIRHLREVVPILSMAQANRYVRAIQRGERPPEELVLLTRQPDPCRPLPIERITGPAI